MTRNHIAAAAAALLLAPAAWAGPVFDYIRIGDRDGFGFTPTAGLVRADPGHVTAADTNGNGILEQGEFLPDLNKDGGSCTGCGDDFDKRSAAEKGNTATPGGSGFTNGALTSGSKWTDTESQCSQMS